MSDSEINSESRNTAARYSSIAAVVAIIGIIDSGYLTAKHYSGGQVPCSVITGCETVLTSSYAEVYGIPTALFGVIAYFLAFSLAVLTAFGNSAMWKYFGVLTALMFCFSVWLIYLQAFVIGAFCQFCLLSAATSLTLIAIYLLSLYFRSK